MLRSHHQKVPYTGGSALLDSVVLLKSHTVMVQNVLY
jgi:hypothetical protein